MTSITLNGPLLKTLLRTRLKGGARELQGIWDSHGGLHRSTLHRWTRGALPQSRNDMLRLCSLLDVDPFCMLNAKNGDMPEAVNQMIYAFQNDHWKPALAFIRDFVGRRTDWPPQCVAREFYSRHWNMADFEHDAVGQRNYYATVILSDKCERGPSVPRTYHFAYRHPALFGKRWFHYGFVVRYGTNVQLTHFGGLTQKCQLTDAQEATRVGTFLGEGPAIFRVASLHDFTLKAMDQAQPGPQVCFPA